METSKERQGFVSLWDLRDELSNWEIMDAYEQVRGAFEDAHPHRMVDASNAYGLTAFPFGRNDERPEDYETEDWETVLCSALPALRRVALGSRHRWGISLRW